MPATPAPLYRDEDARLAALRALQLLDTAPEARYDDLARLAAQLCATPIALVSLVDAERLWFKARVGLGAPQTARASSFCAHTIAASEPLFVVEDASADARFREHPLVAGAPHLRFYAGVTIALADGLALGTLCVADTVPRALAAGPLDALQALARQVAALLELRRVTLAAERLAAEGERERERSAKLLELALRGGDLGLWELDLARGACTINARERAILGVAADEALPERLDWRSWVHPDDRPALEAALARHLRGEVAHCEVEHRLRHRDGHWVWVLDHAVVVERDAAGAALRIVGTHMDISERVRDRQALLDSRVQLEELARVDALTGLPNRRQFDERLHEAMLRSRRTLRSMALMILDIDHLKAVNEQRGAAGGDAVLRELALRLKAGLRRTDIVARYGGDEFVIVLEAIDGVLDLKRLADKIIAGIRPSLRHDGAELAVTVSAGLAIYRGTEHGAAELIALADGALQQARRQGRDRYTLA